MIFAVLVATLYVAASAGYVRIKPGQGIGAVGALSSRGAHVSEAEGAATNAPVAHRGTGALGEPRGHPPASNTHGHSQH
jgi:hypothetical protein